VKLIESGRGADGLVWAKWSSTWRNACKVGLNEPREYGFGKKCKRRCGGAMEN
jgi:hypothetical protein